MVKMMLYIRFIEKYRFFRFVLKFLSFFFGGGTFPHDDGTDSRRKGYPGGLPIKKYIMILFLTFFCNFLGGFYFDPGSP